MFEHLKEKLLNMITSREFLLMIVMIAVASVMIHRVFELQIVHGEDFEGRRLTLVEECHDRWVENARTSRSGRKEVRP